MPELVITDERSTLPFVGRPLAYTLPLGNYTTSYEAKYRLIPLHQVSPEALLGLPLLLEFPNKIWVAVTEANLTDYAGMYLSGVAGRPGVLISRLSPWPENPQVKMKARLPHVSPWRVLMIADDPGRLIESNLIMNLNEPCAIADTSWIKPGKTTFPWWNGYALGDAGFTGGLNTETMKHYLDFCAEAGIEYHSLDGFEDVAWYGGPIVPYQGADITKSLPSIDLDEVRDYARRKSVRLRLWMHCYENHLPMLADYPAACRNQPGLDFIAQVPATWDETRVLNGVVGKYLTIARRRGARWYVGGMTDGSQRELTIPLNFLGPGKYTAEIWTDDPDAPDQPSGLIFRKLEVTSADTIRAAMASAGGHVVRLTPSYKG